jgi:alkanesulfonate monooxygenase SsuD/methylene tetrahydromethanopterin reductase-like flavin-dependent oxidoreductase (luciferase family)
MQFGVFYEHQLPRPWEDDSEQRLIQEALEQVELADRLGLDYAWEVEHHFLEEYSHSSAPEVFLAAASQRTRQLRLGHGIVLMPPAYNHPARVAERIAMLDLVSGGRVEFGTGESASRMELEGFGIDPAEKRAMWQEAVAQVALMLSQSPYAGCRGKYFTMPPRNVVPKPVQRPHPPMWLACSSRPMIHLAAQLGLGALTFAFVDVAEAKHWVADYYDTFERECTPIAQAVNPNIAMVTGFMCHEDGEQAARRGLEGFQFFGYALAHYYLFGAHVPSRTNIWENFRGNQIPMPGGSGGIGTPDQVREAMRQFEEAGVDQTVFIQQGGRNRHEHICEALELFAARVMPEFKERVETRRRRKAERLGPAIERALARRTVPPAAGELAAVHAYGRNVLSGESTYPRAAAKPAPQA